jgi:hypothetical protein
MNGGSIMPPFYVRLATATAVVFVLSSTTVMAGAAPTAEERTKIENTLRQQGYTSWKDIEREGKTWDVDDAVAADGKTYDLKLDAGNLSVSEKKLD